MPPSAANASCQARPPSVSGTASGPPNDRAAVWGSDSRRASAANGPARSGPAGSSRLSGQGSAPGSVARSWQRSALSSAAAAASSWLQEALRTGQQACHRDPDLRMSAIVAGDGMVSTSSAIVHAEKAGTRHAGTSDTYWLSRRGRAAGSAGSHRRRPLSAGTSASLQAAKREWCRPKAVCLRYHASADASELKNAV